MIQAGKLNRVLAIQSQSITHDSFGAEELSWADVASTYCAEWSLTQADTARQQGLAVQSTVKFLIRYRTDVTTQMRVRYAGAAYQITELQTFGNREGLFVFARAV